MHSFLDWISQNYFEIIGALTGILYVILSSRQSIWLWPLGIITSALQLIVFYYKRIYADMSLQGYYVLISIYGWYIWKNGKKKNERKRPVSNLSKSNWALFFFISTVCYFIIRYVLVTYTNSDVANIDAFTTALSITGTFLLTRKKIENWLIWIVVDSVSSGLYIYKNLYMFAVLYAFLTLMSFYGYSLWKKDMVKT